MSRSVDERIVQMQFDNKQFENNVRTSMSTLDKLKNALKFDSASKGFSDLQRASSSINFAAMSNSIDSVSRHFNAMEIAGYTAISHLTTAAMNYGTNLVKSLTIDPVTTGFNEYELKMGSVQTIMMSTGESLDVVMKKLNELNEYSDKTIYSFQDMTSNIGKFTNAGVDLETAVAAIQGVSNEAALSGANANEASRAMYNFAQALSAGYVKLIDWKSIENANMATKDFKQNLIDTAVKVGTLTKKADDMYQVVGGKKSLNAIKDFNDSLQEGWMTTDVLIQTLGMYADETTEVGAKATAAAQDVKTLSQSLNVLKETAQSGWAETWEIVFGDYEESKELFTNFTNYFSDIITQFDDARNNYLREALRDPTMDLKKWNKMVHLVGNDYKGLEESAMKIAKLHNIEIDDMIKKEGSFEHTLKNHWLTVDMMQEVYDDYKGSVADASEETDNLISKTEDLNEVIIEVIQGKYGNSWDERAKQLEELGYDSEEVRLAVNELAKAFNYDFSNVSIEQLQTELEKLGITINKTTSSQDDLNDAQKKGNQLANDRLKKAEANRRKNDEDLAQQELDSYKHQVKGLPLLKESFLNIRNLLAQIGIEAGKAWISIFPPGNKNSLYEFIKLFHDFTSELHLNDEQRKNVFQGFRGFFSFSDIKKTILMSFLQEGKRLVDLFGGDFVTFSTGVLADIGNQMFNLRNWLNDNQVFPKFANIVSSSIEIIINRVREFGKEIKDIPLIQKAFTGIQNIFNKLKETIGKGILDAVNLKASDIVDKPLDFILGGLKNGLNWLDETFTKLQSSEKVKSAIENIKTFFSTLWESVTTISGDAFSNVTTKISELFETITGEDSKFTTDNVVQWIEEKLTSLSDTLSEFTSKMPANFDEFKAWLSTLPETFTNLGTSIGDAISGLYDTVLKAVSSSSESKTKRIGEKIQNFNKETTGPFDGIKETISGFTKFLGWKDLEDAVDSFITVVVALGGLNLTKVIRTFQNWKMNKQSFSESLNTIADAITTLVGALAVIAFVGPEKFIAPMIMLGVFIAALGGLALAIKKLDISDEFNRIGKTINNIAKGIGILAIACVALSFVPMDWIGAGLLKIGAILGGVLALITLFNWFNKKLNLDTTGLSIKRLGDSMLKIAGSVAILAAVAFALGKMREEDFNQGMKGFVILMCGLTAAMIAISKWGNGVEIKSIGVSMLMIAGAMWVLAKAFQQFRDVGDDAWVKSIVALAGALGGLALASAFMTASGVSSGLLLSLGAALVLLAAGMWVFAKAGQELHKVEWADLGKMLAIFAVAMIGFLVISKVATIAAAGLAPFALALLALAAAIYVIALAAPKLGEIGGAILDFLGGIAEWIGKGIIWIAEKIAGLLGGLGEIIWNALGSIANAFRNAIGGLFGITAYADEVNSMDNLVDTIFDPIKNPDLELDPDAYTTQINNLITEVTGGIEGVEVPDTSVITNLLNGYVGSEADVISWITGMSNAFEVSNGFTGVLSGLIKTFSSNGSVFDFASTDAGQLIGSKTQAEIVNILSEQLGVSVEQIESVIGEYDLFGIEFNALEGSFSQKSALSNATNTVSSLKNTINENMVKAVSTALTIAAGASTKSSITRIGDKVREKYAETGKEINEAIVKEQPVIYENAFPVDFYGVDSPEYKVFLEKTRKENAVKQERFNWGIGWMFSSAIEKTPSKLLSIVSKAYDKYSKVELFSKGANLIGKGFLQNASKVLGVISAAANEVDVETPVKEAGEIVEQKFSDVKFDEGTTNAMTEAFWSLVNTRKAESLKMEESSLGKLAESAPKEVETKILTPLQQSVQDMIDTTEWIRQYSDTNGGEGVNQAVLEHLESMLNGKDAVDIDDTTCYQMLQDLPNMIQMAIEDPVKFAEYQSVEQIKAMDSDISIGEALVDWVKESWFDISKIGNLLSGISVPDLLNTFVEDIFPQIQNAPMLILSSIANAFKMTTAYGAETGTAEIGNNIQNSILTPLVNTVKEKFDSSSDSFSEVGSGVIKAIFNSIQSNLKGTKDSSGATGNFIENFSTSLISSLRENINTKLGGELNIMQLITDHLNSESASSEESGSNFMTNFIAGIQAKRSELEAAASQLGEAYSNMFKSKAESTEKTKVNVDAEASSQSGQAAAQAAAQGMLSQAQSSQGELSSAGAGMSSSFMTGIASHTSEFSGVGLDLILSLVEGIVNNANMVSTAASNIVSDAISSAKSTADSGGGDIGYYIVLGMTAGINRNASTAINAAVNMATRALQAAKNALSIHSPSKAFEEVGMYSDMGMANGFTKFGYLVYDSATNIAKGALDTVRDSVKSIGSVFSEDINSSPTIRPIIDLSNVEEGSQYINDMFGQTRDINFGTGTFESINAAMSSIQNGGNADLLSAIQDLKSSLNTGTSNTYNINGITYDDGSNVVGAVESLIHAAMIERRV